MPRCVCVWSQTRLHDLDNKLIQNHSRSHVLESEKRTTRIENIKAHRTSHIAVSVRRAATTYNLTFTGPEKKRTEDSKHNSETHGGAHMLMWQYNDDCDSGCGNRM